ncbi:hypothetical protein [Haloferax sp. ATB1]|uniref:hypothetical protein n=1 Tax=Haloferax sp. ATB1 TaxID=1508454 RepID=UPI0005B1D7A9|nr:hypothetical protein [Haloferax sp. ATB1]
MLNGVEVPDEGSWGYSSGWIPDDIVAARCPLPDKGSTESDTNSSRGGQRSKQFGRVYYAIEVKSVASGNRVRLTENQREMMATVNDTFDHVHPVVVIIDLGGFPESVEITVEMYQESVWADRQASKTI